MTSVPPELRNSALGDTFFVEQKPLAFLTARYRVRDDAGRVVYYAERPKRPWPAKRHVYFYRDDSRRRPVLVIRQGRLWMFGSKHYTLFEDAAVLASFRKGARRSLGRSIWEVYGSDGTLVLEAREDSAVLAGFRRALSWFPFLDLAGSTERADFDLFVIENGHERRIGSVERQFGSFDKYTLKITADPERAVDRRIAIALSVLLDTAEGR